MKDIALIEDPDRFSVYLAIDSQDCCVDVEIGISTIFIMVESGIWLADDE